MALIATILFSNYIQAAKESMGELAQVVVTKADITAGKPIPTGALTTQEVPSNICSRPLFNPRIS